MVFNDMRLELGETGTQQPALGSQALSLAALPPRRLETSQSSVPDHVCCGIASTMHSAEREEALGSVERNDVDTSGPKGADSAYGVPNDANRPYRFLMDHMVEGGVILRPDGVVLYCNRRMTDMLGVPQEQVIGQILQSFVRPLERQTFTRFLAQASRGAARSEFWVGNRGQYKTKAFVSLSLLSSILGPPLLCGIVSDLAEHPRVPSDITDDLLAACAQRDVAESALRQSQKMESVGQLAGGLAHDFNNLLAIIIGSLEVLRADPCKADSSGIESSLNVALTSANRAAALTRRLLAFSRRQTLAPKLMALNSLVSDAGEMVRWVLGPSIRVVTTLDAQTGVVLCDGNQFESAILNLAINARDAMPDGGSLTVATANLDVDEAAAAARGVPAGQYASLSVRDTGSGMSAAVAARAFEPLFTTKPVGRGTGLGLAMIDSFARQAGGQVAIQSTEGIGTTVTILLPRVAVPETEFDGPRKTVQAPETTCAVSNRTILLVEDERDLREVLARMLRRSGYTVVSAGDGRSALGHIVAGIRIDLLITDLGLPSGVNGRQLADAIWALHPDLPVLFTTGAADLAPQSDGDRVDNNRAAEMLVKPFDLNDLADKVRDLVPDIDRVGI